MRPTTTLALSWQRPAEQSLRRDTRALAKLGAALELRRARVLDWVSRQDLAPLGYPNFTTFREQHVEWGGSWERALRRLVKSPLDLVKLAAMRGELALRTAASAPGKVSVAGQGAWLREHAVWRCEQALCLSEQALCLSEQGAAEGAEAGEAQGFDRDLFIGQQALDIQAARQRARVLIGNQAGNPVVDEYIVMAWLDQRPAAQLLDEARTPPDPPDLTPGSWPQGPDPATDVVGPWVEPRDLGHAITLLEQLQAVSRGRRAALGLALDHLARGGHYLEWGYDALKHYGRDELDLSPSSIRRYRKLGATLDLHPELLAAVRGGPLDASPVTPDPERAGLDLEGLDPAGLDLAGLDPAGLDLAGLDPAGLDLDSAIGIGELAQTGNTVRRWLALAHHLGRAEVQRLARLSHATARSTSAADPIVLLKQAEDRVARAPEVLDRLEAGHGFGARGPLQPGQASVAGAAWRVTGPPTPPETSDAGDALTWGHPMLLEAARWFLDTVQLPAQQGCGKAKERQRWVCQNPECRRITVRNQVHHIWHREHGGSDDEDNLITACKSCHLRLIHGGHVEVFRLEDALVWRYGARGPAARVVIVLP